MKEFEVWGEHITLGQLLKVAGVVDSGGEVRYYLAGRPVLVNGQPETRRGRKLVPGDRVNTPGLDLLLTPQGSLTDDPDAASSSEPLYEKPAFQPPAHIGPAPRKTRRVMRRGSRKTVRASTPPPGRHAVRRTAKPTGGQAPRDGATGASPTPSASPDSGT